MVSGASFAVTAGDSANISITAEEISAWERQISASGYTRRTARDARSTLTTVLGDAIPRYIQTNPAQRRRGKGRKGQRRIQHIEQAGKAWATPIQALLVAERCAALSGHDTDSAASLLAALISDERSGSPPGAPGAEGGAASQPR
jgi:hypothetical protein